MNWTTLVSAEELAPHLDDPGLALVDARFVLAGGDPGAGERAWRVSHLPRATYVDLDRDLSDHRRPASEGRHPLPDEADFCVTLERLGISMDSQVVVYDAADGAMAAARFWWLMKLLGHQRVAVLDGGFARWSALGLPLASATISPVPGSYRARFLRSEIATDEEVLRRLDEPCGWLLDARAPERFRGEVEPLDRVAGHVPGALNRPYSLNLRDGMFEAPETLREAFARLLDGRNPKDVVLSCGSGVTACHNLLAMHHAGLPGARIYAGSWSGWISDPARPVELGPAPA